MERKRILAADERIDSTLGGRSVFMRTKGERMGFALLKSAGPFTLHIQCENCLRPSEKIVEVPVGDDAPRDADELIESIYLQSIPFRCQPCGSVIGQLVGITGGNSYGY
jgi:hypothetical protein